MGVEPKTAHTRPMTRQEMVWAEMYRRSCGYEMGMGEAPGESEFVAAVQGRMGFGKGYAGKKSLSELIHGDIKAQKELAITLGLGKMYHNWLDEGRGYE